MDNIEQQKVDLMGEILAMADGSPRKTAKIAELKAIMKKQSAENIESTKFGVYSGDEFFSLDIPKRKWLVEGLIRERDSVIFVGDEKSGKSLFLSQMICSLTSQHPFIDKHTIPEPCRVTQVLLEGDLADIKERYDRMRMTIEFEPSNFQLFFSQPLSLHDKAKTIEFIHEIEDFKPQIVVLDPVYFAFTGSLSDDNIVRQFIGNLRIVQDKLKCALVLVHHTHKSKHDNKGNSIHEGDDAIFGSKFLKAWPDHTIMFNYDKRKQVRRLTCDTQRRGDIIPIANYTLIDKNNNLYFEEITETPTQTNVLFNAFKANPNGLTYSEIKDLTNFSKATFYSSIKPMMRDGVIVKNDGRPVLYKLNPKRKDLI